ncbi:MAG: hypothetical protein AABO41_22315 [Acidobacteriota bacterium]
MSDNRDDLDTQPTLTAILERVQKAETGLYQAIERLAARMEGQIQSVREEVHTVREEVHTVRGEVHTVREEVHAVRGEVKAARLESHDEIQAVRRELHEEVDSLRDEMRMHFRKLDTKFQLLIEDSMDVRANQRDLSKRMDELEVKAS